MNANLAHNIESLFGPSSDLIDISAFLESSTVVCQQEPADEEICPADVAEECSVVDVQESLDNVWGNPTLSGYLVKGHDRTVTALHALNQKSSKSNRKVYLPDPETLTTEVINLQKSLDGVALDSLKLNTDALLFMRTPKNSDQNILQNVKAAPNSQIANGEHNALITLSVHNRVSWGPSYVTRLSQHVFLSSQSLQDVYDAIPCISKRLPAEAAVSEGGSGCFICIESLVYGDGEGSGYASKLIQQLEISSKKSSQSHIMESKSSLKDTKLYSLSLRINEPYWMSHQGNCEHFLVVDQIRLAHPSDPRIGYPLTIHITPPLLDLCRACTKVPASWSVVGDIRLGESPCVLCGPCLRNMGDYEEEGVAVLPLPRYPL